MGNGMAVPHRGNSKTEYGICVVCELDMGWLSCTSTLNTHFKPVQKRKAPLPADPATRGELVLDMGCSQPRQRLSQRVWDRHLGSLQKNTL